MAHDWITGNLYGVSRNGIVFVCNTSSSELLDCEVLLSGQGDLIGIALNPIEGYDPKFCSPLHDLCELYDLFHRVMYWTHFRGGTIRRAEMDGSALTTLLSGLGNPRGITVAFDSSRLYWVEKVDGKVQ